MTNDRGSAGIAVVLVLLAIGLAIANVLVFASSSDPSLGVASDIGPLLAVHWQRCPGCIVYFAATPLLFGLLAAVVAARRGKPAAKAVAPTVVADEPDSSALRLLGLLQQEARFIDFIREDINGYDDAQVGAAARTIHSGCRKALDGRIELERILPEEEGADVEIASGFDPAEVRLSGNVAGEPPFRGTLEHPGWKVAKVQLPESPGNLDPRIIAPAQVEVR